MKPGKTMQRLLSTYLFISKKLTPELLGQIAEAGFQGIEIFCTGSHFEYALKQEVRAMAGALEAQRQSLGNEAATWYWIPIGQRNGAWGAASPLMLAVRD